MTDFEDFVDAARTKYWSDAMIGLVFHSDGVM